MFLLFSENADDDVFYEFIENSCGNPDEISEGTLSILENGEQARASFSIQSFQFRDISDEIFFHCQV